MEAEIRSSSWGELFDCAYRWEAKHLLGMTLPATGAMHLGTACHEGTRAYDQHKLDGDPISIDDAEGIFVDTLTHPEQPIERTRTDLSPIAAERVGRALITKYCRLITPQFRYRAVEIRPEPLEIQAEGVTVRLTGQLDRTRIRASGGGIAVADLKTGKRAVTTEGRAVTKGHIMQLGVYELLAEHCLNEPVTGPSTIIGMQTAGPARIGLGEISNARAGLIGTEDKPGLIQMAANMLKTGSFSPNPSSMLCHERYCPRFRECPYHG